MSNSRHVLALSKFCTNATVNSVKLQCCEAASDSAIQRYKGIWFCVCRYKYYDRPYLIKHSLGVMITDATWTLTLAPIPTRDFHAPHCSLNDNRMGDTLSCGIHDDCISQARTSIPINSLEVLCETS